MRIERKDGVLLLTDGAAALPFTAFDSFCLERMAAGESVRLFRELRAAFGPAEGHRLFTRAARRLGRLARHPAARAPSGPEPGPPPEPLPTPLPLVATVFLTWRCRANCAFCDFEPLRRSPSRELSAPEWKAVLGDIAAMGGRTVVLTGGEPALHPGFAEIAAAVSALGMELAVQTRDPSAAPLLERLRPRAVMVGLDTLSPRTAAALYPAGPAPRELLSLAARLAAAGTETVASVVVSDLNRDELPALFSALASAGVRRVVLASDRRAGRPAPPDERRRWALLAGKAGLRADVREGGPPSPERCSSCNVGVERCILAPDGSMLLCDQPGPLLSGATAAPSFSLAAWTALRSAASRWLSSLR